MDDETFAVDFPVYVIAWEWETDAKNPDLMYCGAFAMITVADDDDTTSALILFSTEGAAKVFLAANFDEKKTVQILSRRNKRELRQAIDQNRLAIEQHLETPPLKGVAINPMLFGGTDFPPDWWPLEEVLRFASEPD
jgi:hypothetical protein